MGMRALCVFVCVREQMKRFVCVFNSVCACCALIMRCLQHVVVRECVHVGFHCRVRGECEVAKTHVQNSERVNDSANCVCCFASPPLR